MSQTVSELTELHRCQNSLFELPRKPGMQLPRFLLLRLQRGEVAERRLPAYCEGNHELGERTRVEGQTFALK